MSVLSIFVDESGDFGRFQRHSPYYIVAMVMHDQDINIQAQIDRLDDEIRLLGHEDTFVIHTEPLIRREEMYRNYSPNERRALFTKLFFFLMKTELRFKTFVFEKKQFDNQMQLEARMARDFSRFVRDHLSFFQSFDRVILYYDNGQHELNRMLNTLLATELSQYDVRRVMPKDYKLFQVADLICTLELLSLKCERNELTKSELLLFHSARDLRKQFLKPFRDKQFE